MLRINLLPAYVALRRLNNQLFALFGFLIVLILVSALGYNYSLSSQIGPLNEKTQEATAAKSAIDTLNSQAQAATATIAPLQTKLQFVKDIQTYNLAYIKLFQNIARYTTPKILYKSITVSGTTMTIQAYTPSFADLGRYLQLMYTEPDVNSVSISSIPGYGTNNTDTIDSGSIPSGVIGHLPGYPGPVMSYSVYRGQIVGVNGHTIVSPPAPRPFNLKTDGFPVTVTLALKSALSPPPVPGTAPAAGRPGPGGPPGPGAPSSYSAG